MDNNNILLSILLPTYNYPLGVDRILAVFTKVNPSFLASIEFIISDDSDLDCEKIKINEISFFYKNQYGLNINYILGSKTKNPVDNWNKLIGLSRGVYKQIIHHDDFFISETHIENLLQFINSEEPDICILRLYKADKFYLYKHMPLLIVNFFLKLVPSFILLKNFIGPSACIVFKTKSETFNPNLKWIVDVDWYFKILTKSTKILFCYSIPIASEFNYHNSITSRIKEKKKILKLKELKMINFQFKIYHHFFLFLWPILKLYNIVANFFIKKPINDCY